MSPFHLFMPRKRVDEALQVINLLKFRGMLHDFDLLPVHNSNEAHAAAALRESLLFLSFGYPEGFGLPPLEAMACGCLTIGYHGFGGSEYFNEEHGFPVPMADTLAFAKRVETVLEQWRANPQPLMDKASRASACVREIYTPQRESADIVAAWEQILCHRSGREDAEA
jgi:glycosyltransferase involved in cell wall biosynthesis